MTLKNLLPLAFSSALFISAFCNAQDTKSSEEQMYRPNFHFTPKNNWMNDPNGLFFADGAYHLYFQYWPYGNKWGPMHWGHATEVIMYSVKRSLKARNRVVVMRATP